MIETQELLLEPYIRYKKFVEECRTKIYHESLVLHKHHIIPKNLGGENISENLLSVSVEDHIKLHLLLSECFPENNKGRIDNLRSARVLNKKSIKDKETLNKISRTYVGENNPFYGKKHNKETIEKLRESSKKRKGVSYEALYGENSNIEKERRKQSVKKHWSSMTHEEKEERRKKISHTLKTNKSLSGGKNPFAKKVKVNEITFDSISEACEYFGVNSYFLNKQYNIKRL